MNKSLEDKRKKLVINSNSKRAFGRLSQKQFNSKINWGIYEKRKKLIIWAFILNLSIVIAGVLYLPLIGRTRSAPHPVSRDLSYLKQIGTSVAIYFIDQKVGKFPKCPRDFEFDDSLVNYAVQDTWYDLSYSSPYYFFPEEGSTYTGSAWRPLAVRKKPIKNKTLCTIVYQDGHAKNITPLYASSLIFISESYKLIKSILFRSK